MELKKLNVSFAKTKGNSITSRLVLPITWIRELNITEEDREVCVYKSFDKIYISKDPIKFYKETVIDEVFAEFKALLKSKKWVSTIWLKDKLNSYANVMLIDKEKEEQLLTAYIILLDKFKEYDDKKFIEEKIESNGVEFVEQSLFEEVSQRNYSLPFEEVEEENTILYFYSPELDFKKLDEFKLYVGLTKPELIKIKVKDKTSKEILNILEDMDDNERDKLLSSMKRIKKKKEKKAEQGAELTAPADKK
jgi:hypothetical protein